MGMMETGFKSKKSESRNFPSQKLCCFLPHSDLVGSGSGVYKDMTPGSSLFFIWICFGRLEITDSPLKQRSLFGFQLYSGTRNITENWLPRLGSISRYSIFNKCLLSAKLNEASILPLISSWANIPVKVCYKQRCVNTDEEHLKQMVGVRRD